MTHVTDTTEDTRNYLLMAGVSQSNTSVRVDLKGGKPDVQGENNRRAEVMQCRDGKVRMLHVNQASWCCTHSGGSNVMPQLSHTSEYQFPPPPTICLSVYNSEGQKQVPQILIRLNG